MMIILLFGCIVYRIVVSSVCVVLVVMVILLVGL